MRKLDDITLVAKVLQNDEEAFNEIYRRYHKLVRYIAFQLTRNSADADEVLQDVFVQVQKSLKDLKDPKNLKAWISRITYSKAKLLFRSRKDVYLDSDKIEVLYNKLEDRMEYLPSEKAKYQANFDVLYKCILTLSDDYREVISLFYFGQMSLKEIIAILNIPEGTVKSRLLYAKKNLRKAIVAYEERTQDKVRFHSLSTALMGLGFCMVGKKPVSLFLFKTRIKELSFLQTSAVVATAVSVSVVAGSTINHLVQDRKDVNKEAFVSNFKVVNYQGEEITTPKQAYKTLLDWADCEVEMKEKTKQEYLEIEPVFHALQSYGEGYYDLLVQFNWSTQFSKSIQNK